MTNFIAGINLSAALICIPWITNSPGILPIALLMLNSVLFSINIKRD